MLLTSVLSLFGLASIASAAPAASVSGDNLATAQWDVIVVGSGPAGIITATKMAEAGKKTLLLEQGGPSYYITGGRDRPSWLQGTNLSRVDVPGLYKSIFSEKSDMLCTGYAIPFGGCTIGGSSAINAGLFFQPPRSDFERYFPQGWKSADVADAISRLYSRVPAGAQTSENGLLYLQQGYAAAKQWLVGHAGYTETRFKASPDDKSKVFGHPVFDYIDAQRGGPVRTYLQDALKLNNFKLQSGVKVLRVARSGGRAFGVVAKVNGASQTIQLAPNGRVILSGGAIQSPALLMKSAIGDPFTLQRLYKAGMLPGHGPSTWINNTAVGKGLFDNPNTFIELRSNKVNSYTYDYNNPNPRDSQLYLNKRSGPYSFASETSAFWDTVKHNDGSVAICQGTIDSSGYSQFNDGHTITLNVYGTSGLGSSGKVVLDKNFLPGPSADVYYSDPQDARDIATFIRRIFDALPQSSLTPLNIDQKATHAQIVDYITKKSDYARGMVNHWSSSCRFGRCIDTNTIVKGTTNVHVVDGSIVPPLSVNPQMGIMIAAEHASEKILSL